MRAAQNTAHLFLAERALARGELEHVHVECTVKRGERLGPAVGVNFPASFTCTQGMGFTNNYDSP